MVKKIYIIVLGVLLCVLNAHGNQAPQKFIRDSEIENTLRLLSNGLIEQLHLNREDINFYLIDDKNINAFVAGGQNIFFYTGLLLATQYPEELMGVIAHELGHIEGGHLSKIQDAKDKSTKYALLSSAISVPLAILAQDGKALAGAIIGASSSAARGFFSYTRDMERQADQTALTLFKQNGTSNKFFYNFLKKLEEKEAIYQQKDTANSYTSTHPLSRERLGVITSHIDDINTPLTFTLPPVYYDLFYRMRAKILAYTKPKEALQRLRGNFLYPKGPPINKKLIQELVKAIAYMRLNKKEEAIKAIQYLTQSHPNDPFILETAGDIYYHFNDNKQAITMYKSAGKLIPWSGLIALGLAKSYHRVLRAETADASIDDIISTLNMVTRFEPHNIEAWQLKSYWYKEQDNAPAYNLAEAEIALLRGDTVRAKHFATRARDDKKSSQNIKLRVSDILLQLSKS